VTVVSSSVAFNRADPQIFIIPIPDCSALSRIIMTESTMAYCHISSDMQIPRSILRAMDGAKAFLHSSLLNVPWMWRMNPAASTISGEIVTDELRHYQKTIRSQINVEPSPVPDVYFLAPSPNPQ
jgi:hypothetical protein